MSKQTETLAERIEGASEFTIKGQVRPRGDFTQWLQNPFSPERFTRIQPEFIDKWMCQLGVNDIRLYLLLCRCGSNAEGISWQSVRRLAKELNISERTISRITCKLQKLGLIEKGCYRLEGKLHNIYRIVLLQTPDADETPF